MNEDEKRNAILMDMLITKVLALEQVAMLNPEIKPTYLNLLSQFVEGSPVREELRLRDLLYNSGLGLDRSE